MAKKNKCKFLAGFLKKEGCDEIQGFLISRPMTADNVITLFEQKLLPQ